MPKEFIEQFEVTDQHESNKVAEAGRMYHLFVMLVKVLLANAVMFWAQATFFMLAFEKIGNLNKEKLIAGMVICAISMFVRSVMAAAKLGVVGFVLGFVVLLVAAWAASAVMHAYHCPSHVWTFTGGCMN